jgi:hypothetical protein
MQPGIESGLHHEATKEHKGKPLGYFACNACATGAAGTRVPLHKNSYWSPKSGDFGLSTFCL